jgi:outer membrane protein OmpA-like peptidoglycan-associated protein
MQFTLLNKLFPAALLVLFVAFSANAQSISVQVANEAAVNTDQLDFSPTFYQDGIVFISSRNAGLKKKKDDKIKMQAFSILQSLRSTEGVLSAATPFSGAITTKLHEGPVCFNASADMIYFSSNISKKGKKPKKAKDGEVKMKIYTSTLTGATWSAPVELPFNPAGEWNVCHPTLSIAGDRLIFASDQKGGNGGMDLYVSYLVGDSWSEPINLGNKINTSGNDIFPFLHADNTLYFSSDTRGKGGLDIFYSTPDGSEYASPVNIGAPFNTAGDDFGLIVDLDKINGYFTSNGNGGAGADDIFSFNTSNGNLDDYLLLQGRPVNKWIDLIVNVIDPQGKPVPNADVKIIKLDQGVVAGRDSAGNAIVIRSVDGVDVLAPATTTPVVTETTDANGRVLADVMAGSYVINAAKSGYQTKQLPVILSKTGNEFTLQLESAADLVRFNTVLLDETTGAPLAGAMIIMTNAATGAKETVYTDENGALDYYLQKDADYNMEVYQNNKLIGESKLTAAQIATGGSAAKTSVRMSSGLTDGSVIELPNIYYNFNDATLRPEARKDLDPVVAMMNQYPKMRIRINSHTDSRGSTSENQDLSTRRAKSVLAYLVKKGIKSNRMEVKGFGESNIRNACKDGVACEEKDHARNRRTELQILSGLDSLQVAYREGTLGLQNAPKVSGGASGKLTFSAGTKFYLVAGSFLMQTRAQSRLNELVKAGYENASIVQFPKSPYYSVCVDKLDGYDSAQKLKSEFFAKTSIESFVRPD